MQPLVHAVQIALAYIECDIHFEYVPSAANLADIPSRDPRTRSQEDLDVLSELGLGGPGSERSFVIPTLDDLADFKTSLTSLAELCRTDPS